MIVAGEASGDTHAAKLVSALKALDDSVKFDFFGSAGEKMRAVGVRPVVKADELSVVGLVEIGGALPMFFRAFRALRNAAKAEKPDVAVLVDFPDFNLRLARTLKKMGVPVVYYISPQIWAWRSYRANVIRKYVDLLLTILPFEKDWYAKHGIDHVEFVGNPLAREVHPTLEKDEFLKKHALDPNDPIIALLPGSRRKEIERLLPLMIDSARQMREKNDKLQFVTAAASSASRDLIEKVLIARDAVDLLGSSVLEGETYNILNAADAAAISSGTATLEAAILGVPMVIVFKTSATNYNLLEPLVSSEHYGLINLIANKRIVKEMIQNDLTVQTLTDELERLLIPETNTAVRAELIDAAKLLGKGGASKRAAEAVLKLISWSRSVREAV